MDCKTNKKSFESLIKNLSWSNTLTDSYLKFSSFNPCPTDIKKSQVVFPNTTQNVYTVKNKESEDCKDLQIKHSKHNS